MVEIIGKLLFFWSVSFAITGLLPAPVHELLRHCGLQTIFTAWLGFPPAVFLLVGVVTCCWQGRRGSCCGVSPGWLIYGGLLAEWLWPQSDTAARSWARAHCSLVFRWIWLRIQHLGVPWMGLGCRLWAISSGYPLDTGSFWLPDSAE